MSPQPASISKEEFGKLLCEKLSGKMNTLSESLPSLIRDHSSYSSFMMLLKNVNGDKRLGLRIANSTSLTDGESSDQTLRCGIVEQIDGPRNAFTYLIDKDGLHFLVDQFAITVDDKPFTFIFSMGNEVIYAYHDKSVSRRAVMNNSGG